MSDPAPRTNRPSTDFGLLILRAAVGLDLAYHGAQKLFGQPWGGWWTTKADGSAGVPEPAATMEARIKGFAGFLENGLGLPYPEINAWAAAITEFAGGLMVALGLLCRFGALGLAGAMAVAAFVAHRHAFDARAGGLEFPAILFCAALALIFTGPGRFSIDQALFGRKKATD